MLLVTWSGVAVSEICYTVEGEVKTENMIETGQQVGTIDLQLYNENDDEVFRETGNLIGHITGGSTGVTYLSHSAVFDDGSTFLTNGDIASVTVIRKFGANNLPCAFDVQEVISHIASGTGFFNNVSRVEINADGYVNTCIAEGDNENEFQLTGTLCVD
jgi:hypothetical protein